MISKDLATILSRISFWDSKVTLNNKTLKNLNVSLQNQFSKDMNKFKIKNKEEHNHGDKIRLERLIFKRA